MKHSYFYNQTLTVDLILKKPRTFKNIMQLPRVNKIVIDTTNKAILKNPKYLMNSILFLESLSGQIPTLTFAKKSIATLKLKKNQILGCMLTLKKDRIYSFFHKLIHVSLPLVHDFWGIRGNVSNNDMANKGIALGLNNIMIFPEIENNYLFLDDFYTNTIGANINIVFKPFCCITVKEIASFFRLN
uniref:Ribosomal protein L5 n=1 Tax=Symbiochloris sp. SG-2018 TaxID=2126034 RepID=A0A976U7N4_9CHLO|nr:ribosomal protein L5 [Symbiochloris sp. SG-2018]UVF37880.1 ribosomal protein L5 [Symbiochloris sp. SG-2018]